MACRMEPPIGKCIWPRGVLTPGTIRTLGILYFIAELFYQGPFYDSDLREYIGVR
jgi:hypothetical protein